MISMNVKRLNRVLTILLNEMKELDDEGRDLPIRWNVMHMYSSSQLAKIVAIKRNLDPELAGLIAVLHDIAVVKTKKKDNHAERAEPFINEIINLYNSEYRRNLNEITKEDRKIIIEAVSLHSQKDIKTDNKYVELMKDVDSIDRLLHGVKSDGSYVDRCYNVFEELNLPKDILELK